MSELQLYRKRLIPDECILLKDDIIVKQTEELVITSWNTLNPKIAFSHGCSCYFLNEGFKISKFYRQDGSLLYWYCDIVEYARDEQAHTLTATDLLADVIVYPDGRIKVVDLGQWSGFRHGPVDRPTAFRRAAAAGPSAHIYL